MGKVISHVGRLDYADSNIWINSNIKWQRNQADVLRTLMLEDGGKINGGFLRAGLVDDYGKRWKTMENDTTMNTRVMKMKTIAVTSILSLLMVGQVHSQLNRKKEATDKMEQKERYTFTLSDKVSRQAVIFKNRYGITIAGDLYMPKDRGSERLAALVISGPFGAVKEQSSGLHANELAARGFVALTFDPSFTGESGGEIRNGLHPV